MKPLTPMEVTLLPADPAHPHGEQIVQRDGREIFRVPGPEADVVLAGLAGWHGGRTAGLALFDLRAALRESLLSGSLAAAVRLLEKCAPEPAVDRVIAEARSALRLTGREG
jgi:hypothetical protein